MSELLVIWLATLTLVTGVALVGLLALGRQVGLMYSRMPPQGARMGNPGPEVGDRVPAEALQTLEGQPVMLADGRTPTLALFMSISCDVCKLLVPALRSIQRSDGRQLQLVVVLSRISPDEAHTFVRSTNFGRIPIVLATELALRWKVLTSPYGVLLSADGIVRSKGLVNNMDHLDSLLKAAELGITSVDELHQAHEHQHRPAFGTGTAQR